ncbi:MAG TPA: polyphenol oxidase family protein, partial [Thermoanaerobaculia bacterium]|nr:polyphenol oxidase family protein [Thermoanaerobaculia bacterium]
DRGPRSEARFVGRGADGSRAEVLAAITGGERPPPAGPAAARQVHGADVLAGPEGGPFECGDGDALITRQEGLALSVITADCVPVLVEAGEWIAAVHAGWRGLVAGVVAATADRLRTAGGAGPPEAWVAWIGPTIGPCCYEVDDDVATRVAGASAESVVSRPRRKPHLDLVAAAHHQLAAVGVADRRAVAACTRCDAGRRWSYRREGRRAGRNHAFIWKRPR